ncbi:MAG: YdeI/OmpD-associated family protein, partial [Bacteroidales bacterium]|nr:YdeI/OmpD-associated family protein [Bacteroidales bacterium]
EDESKSSQMFHEIPEFFTRALKDNPAAERAFNSLTPSYKLQFLGWVMDAKREEIRLRRMKEALELLESGNKIGIK